MTPAGWAWIGLVVLVAAYVTGFDVWAQVTNHTTMSGQFHNWMQDQLIGPLAIALWAAVSAGFVYHFLINK